MSELCVPVQIEMKTSVWPDGTISRAWFSEDGTKRYMLERDWRRAVDGTKKNKVVTFVMLNPSTADAHKDDPTISRCSAFARRWGYDRMIVVNLFAHRATEPDVLLMKGIEPMPDDNDNNAFIFRALQESQLTIAAWGAHPAACRRDEYVTNHVVRRHGFELHCLGFTKDGHPRHPLYLRGDTQPELYHRLILIHRKMRR